MSRPIFAYTGYFVIKGAALLGLATAGAVGALPSFTADDLRTLNTVGALSLCVGAPIFALLEGYAARLDARRG